MKKKYCAKLNDSVGKWWDVVRNDDGTFVVFFLWKKRQA